MADPQPTNILQISMRSVGLFPLLDVTVPGRATGSSIAVCGVRGTGKTTFLRSLALTLMAPDAARYYLAMGALRGDAYAVLSGAATTRIRYTDPWGRMRRAESTTRIDDHFSHGSNETVSPHRISETICHEYVAALPIFGYSRRRFGVMAMEPRWYAGCASLFGSDALVPASMWYTDIVSKASASWSRISTHPPDVVADSVAWIEHLEATTSLLVQWLGLEPMADVSRVAEALGRHTDSTLDVRWVVDILAQWTHYATCNGISWGLGAGYTDRMSCVVIVDGGINSRTLKLLRLTFPMTTFIIGSESLEADTVIGLKLGDSGIVSDYFFK